MNNRQVAILEYIGAVRNISRVKHFPKSHPARAAATMLFNREINRIADLHITLTEIQEMDINGICNFHTGA